MCEYFVPYYRFREMDVDGIIMSVELAVRALRDKRITVEDKEAISEIIKCLIDLLWKY